MATDATKSPGEQSELVISNINTKVAALLRMMPDQILIEDIASNLSSNNVYISGRRTAVDRRIYLYTSGSGPSEATRNGSEIMGKTIAELGT